MKKKLEIYIETHRDDEEMCGHFCPCFHGYDYEHANCRAFWSKLVPRKRKNGKTIGYLRAEECLNNAK